MKIMSQKKKYFEQKQAEVCGVVGLNARFEYSLFCGAIFLTLLVREEEEKSFLGLNQVSFHK